MGSGIRRRNSFYGALVVVMLAVAMTAQIALAGTYVAGGTVVYKEAGNEPEADRGIVVCSQESGIGGACLPFPDDLEGAVRVEDLLFDSHVAFQVCIDNNGDGLCSSGGDKGPLSDCADDVYFSHDDEGNFFNPLGPLPTTRKPCAPAESGWNGYVVFLCEGVHTVRDGLPTHSHPATVGTVQLAPPSQSAGYGDFCGGTRDLVVEKNYVLL